MKVASSVGWIGGDMLLTSIPWCRRMLSMPPELAPHIHQFVPWQGRDGRLACRQAETAWECSWVDRRRRLE